MSRAVEVRTPARLHFGLSSFGSNERQFSGLGLMVDGTGVRLRVSAANSFAAVGPLQNRVEVFAQSFARHNDLSCLPACQIDVLRTPPDHVGLGTGTQLGLAVAAGLAEWLNINWQNVSFLSQASGRGRRSSIGTYGFLRGGMLFDGGKLTDEQIGQLHTRVELPADWRFILVRPHEVHGLAGSAEANAIATLQPVPKQITDSLHTLIEHRILPAAQSSDWQEFSNALYAYGYRAGECFAAAQGGPFASREIAHLVEHIRNLGFPGAGQSSWGPTVFAVAPNEDAARVLVGDLRQNQDYRDFHITVTQPNTSGASVEEVSLGQSL